MGKAIVLTVVALAVGLLVYWLASPRKPASVAVPPISTESAKPADSQGKTGSSSISQPVPTPGGPIAPPETAQEKEHDVLESRRSPLYGQLHRNLGAALVAVRPNDDDASTLDLYAAQDAPGNTLTLLKLALQSNVSYYGFRHIRFYVPNPAQSIEKFRLDAEASVDSAGNWQTFTK